MPRPCSICTHPNRAEIDRLIVSGEPNRRIAAQFGATESAIRRHRADHLARDLVKAQEAEVVARADNLLEDVRTAQGRLERLYQCAEGILERAEEAKDFKAALQAIRSAIEVMREARAHIELRGELKDELQQRQAELGPMVLKVIALPRAIPGEKRPEVVIERTESPEGAGVESGLFPYRGPTEGPHF